MGGGAPFRLLAVAFWVFGAPPAAAAEDPRVTVDCPSLGPELVASLEARAKADLLVRGAAGSLVITCKEGTTLLFSGVGAAPRFASIPAPVDSRESVDVILETLDSLLAEQVPQAPARASPPPEPPPKATAGPHEKPEQAADVPSSAGMYVAAGVHAELWSSDIGVAIGPRVRGVLSLPNGLSLSLGALALFSIKDASSVAGRVERGFAGVAYAPGLERRAALGVEIGFDVLHALPEASLQTKAATYVAPVADVHVEYTVFSGPVRLAAGLHGGLHAGPVKVELGEREVFRIPAFTGGLALEGVFGPL